MRNKITFRAAKFHIFCLFCILCSCAHIHFPNGALSGPGSGVVALAGTGRTPGQVATIGGGTGAGTSGALMPRQLPTLPKPKWHPPWKLYRVVAGHTGWVRCLAFDPTNSWFATGSNDRTIKVYIKHAWIHVCINEQAFNILFMARPILVFPQCV